MEKKVIRQERGWAGHYIFAGKCYFRRNTLLTCEDTMVVVSTVGNLDGTAKPLGIDGHLYETHVYLSDPSDQRFHDADVMHQVHLSFDARIFTKDSDDVADSTHERAVEEIAVKLLNGSI